MKRKVMITAILTAVVLMATSCIVINPPAPSVAPQATQSMQAEEQNTAAPAPTASLPPAVTATPAPTSTLGDPPALPPLGPLTINTRLSSYSNSHIDVNIHCPEIVGMQDAMMQNGINTGVYGYLTGRAVTLENKSVQDETDYGAHPPYSFETEFDVKRNDGAILSIVINIMTYEGGAHPVFETATINAVNSDPGDQMSLQDLFVPGTNYVLDVTNEIDAIMLADPATYGDFWFTGIDAHQAYYLTDTHLVIMFDAYTIAPGAFGAPEFAIPYGNLTNLANF